MKPLVSVCCLTYNHEKYIADAIESFLSQKTTFPYEIIIHDDASTDSTTKIIQCYAEKYPNLIKTIYQKENQFTKGNNKLLASTIIPLARGEYIATCEGDDYWSDSRKLQKQVDILTCNNDVSICFHRVKVVNSNKETTGRYLGPQKNKAGYYKIDNLLSGGIVHLSSIMTRKKYFENMKILPNWYKNAIHGDFVYVFYLSTCGSAYYINEVMSNYRIGVENSLMTNIRENYTDENEILYQRQRILTFEKADQYYNYKFHKEIENINLQSKLRINFLSGDYGIRTIGKYIHIYGMTSFIKQVLIFDFPKLFNTLSEIKNKINKNMNRS